MTTSTSAVGGRRSSKRGIECSGRTKGPDRNKRRRRRNAGDRFLTELEYSSAPLLYAPIPGAAKCEIYNVYIPLPAVPARRERRRESQGTGTSAMVESDRFVIESRAYHVLRNKRSPLRILLLQPLPITTVRSLSHSLFFFSFLQEKDGSMRPPSSLFLTSF